MESIPNFHSWQEQELLFANDADKRLYGVSSSKRPRLRESSKIKA
jgi:hypothetical protein